MSIQLQGNAESTFANDVTIGGDKITLSGSDGSVTFAGFLNLERYSPNRIFLADGIGGKAYALYVTAGDGTTVNLGLGIDGSANFSGRIDAATSAPSNYAIVATNNTTDSTATILARNSGTGWLLDLSNATGNVASVKNDGSASFSGNVTAPNTFLALDTGGVLDVKERIQNTQAILYRLKAALIQPDADANQLRTRLLEALDILTSDGDES